MALDDVCPSTCEDMKVIATRSFVLDCFFVLILDTYISERLSIFFLMIDIHTQRFEEAEERTIRWIDRYSLKILLINFYSVCMSTIYKL